MNGRHVWAMMFMAMMISGITLIFIGAAKQASANTRIHRHYNRTTCALADCAVVPRAAGLAGTEYAVFCEMTSGAERRVGLVDVHRRYLGAVGHLDDATTACYVAPGRAKNIISEGQRIQMVYESGEIDVAQKILLVSVFVNLIILIITTYTPPVDAERRLVDDYQRGLI